MLGPEELLVGLVVLVGIGEGKIAVFRELLHAGEKADLRLDVVACGCGAEKIPERHDAGKLVGMDPACLRHWREGRRDVEIVGEEFLYLDRFGTEEFPCLLFVIHNQIERGRVGSCRRIVQRSVRKFLEARGAERDFFGRYFGTLRVDDPAFERGTIEADSPVSCLDDHADVHRVAGPVDASVGKEKRVYFFRVGRAGYAARIEVRVVERSSVSRVGHERHVLALADRIGDGLFFLFVAGKVRDRNVPVASRDAGDERVAIEAENRDGRARNRVSRAYGLHEDIPGLVGIRLHEKAEVSDHDDAFVLEIGRIVGAAACREHEESVAQILFRDRVEVAREIKREIVDRSGSRNGDFAPFVVLLGDVVFVEVVVFEAERIEVSVRLRYEVVDVVGPDASEVELYVADVAREHGNLLAAGQRDDRPVGKNGHFFRVLLDLEDCLIGFLEEIVSVEARSFLQLEVDVTAWLGLEAEAVDRVVVVLVGDRLERERLGTLEHRRAHELGRFPGEILLSLESGKVRPVLGQDPCGNVFHELGRIDVAV